MSEIKTDNAQYFCFKCDQKIDTAGVCPSCGGVTKKITDLRNFMLQDYRQYVIDKIKAPMLKAIVILANRLKIEPTKQNTNHPNTDVLIDIWDRFFQLEDNPIREPLFRALRKIVISEYEHDPYYRDRMNVFVELILEEILNGRWRPRALDHPPSNWKADPNIRGIGFEFIKERFENKGKVHV